MITIPNDFLARVAVVHNARNKVLIAAIQPILAATLERYGIDTVERVAYWAGQVCVESDQFSTTTEYASGAAYEGRADLGNTHKGDGVRFKGRGLIQLTGRANYMAACEDVDFDVWDHPEHLADMPYALEVACWFWRKHNLNHFADSLGGGDIEGLTRAINGGLNGIVERDEATDRAFKALGLDTTS